MLLYNKLKKQLKYLFLFITDLFFILLIKQKKQNVSVIKNKVLCVVYDRIGDNIVRSEILKRIVQVYQHVDLYFLVNNDVGLIEYLKILQLSKKEFILFKRIRFILNPFYRSSVINAINNMKFAQTIVFGTGDWTGKKYFTHYIATDKMYYYTMSNLLEYVLDAEAKLYEMVTQKKPDIELLIPNLRPVIKYIKAFTTSLPEQYIVIGIGASSIARKYPVEKMVQVIAHLNCANKTLVFLGKGKADQKYFDALMKQFKFPNKQIISLINKLSFPQSLQVLSRATLFVGVESALFNAAVFLHIPNIVIYGGGNYGLFMHSTATTLYVSNKMSCFGCGWKECKHGILNYASAKCISSIHPTNIIDAINQKIQ